MTDLEKAARQALEQPADELPFARSLSDELMDCVDRLGSEYDTVDPRVWDHLMVYAPKKPAAQWVWLTLEDRQAICDKGLSTWGTTVATEAKLREKNKGKL